MLTQLYNIPTTYLYRILYVKIIPAKTNVITFAIATGRLPLIKPYISHKKVPAVNIAYIDNDMPEVSFVRIVLMACGKNETVVPKAAK
jgi:hypothetical protein